MRDPDSGQLWLQYWLWYIYNDYHLAFNAGLHEGDWEMVQVGMDGDEPKVAVYAQHDQAERRDWSLVRKTPDGRPVVFSARGSHDSYFQPGLYETEAWYDVCDGAQHRAGHPARRRPARLGEVAGSVGRHRVTDQARVQPEPEGPDQAE